MGGIVRSQFQERVPCQTLAAWTRLLDIHLAAAYLSVGESTIRDWIADGMISPVRLPGSTLRSRSGRIISHSKHRRIVKILLDREDLNRFIKSIKAGN
jgi:excisionase family DNA binding protein